jgi:malate synthase
MSNSLKGLDVRGNVPSRYEAVLNESSLSLLLLLHRKFERKRQELLQQREVIYQRIAAGEHYLPNWLILPGHKPTFLPETKKIREGTWKVSPVKNTTSSILDRTVDVVCWRVFDESFIGECLNSGANGIQFDYDDRYGIPPFPSFLHWALQLFCFLGEYFHDLA